jgi:hypothetical protein
LWTPADDEPETEEAEPEKPAGDRLYDKPQKKSQADLLVARVSQAAHFHDSDGEGYATIPVDGHQETWLLKSKGF